MTKCIDGAPTGSVRGRGDTMTRGNTQELCGESLAQVRIAEENKDGKEDLMNFIR